MSHSKISKLNESLGIQSSKPKGKRKSSHLAPKKGQKKQKESSSPDQKTHPVVKTSRASANAEQKVPSSDDSHPVEAIPAAKPSPAPTLQRNASLRKIAFSRVHTHFSLQSSITISRAAKVNAPDRPSDVVAKNAAPKVTHSPEKPIDPVTTTHAAPEITPKETSIQGTGDIQPPGADIAQSPSANASMIDKPSDLVVRQDIFSQYGKEDLPSRDSFVLICLQQIDDLVNIFSYLDQTHLEYFSQSEPFLQKFGVLKRTFAMLEINESDGSLLLHLIFRTYGSSKIDLSSLEGIMIRHLTSFHFVPPPPPVSLAAPSLSAKPVQEPSPSPRKLKEPKKAKQTTSEFHRLPAKKISTPSTIPPEEIQKPETPVIPIIPRKETPALPFTPPPPSVPFSPFCEPPKLHLVATAGKIFIKPDKKKDTPVAPLPSPPKLTSPLPNPQGDILSAQEEKQQTSTKTSQKSPKKKRKLKHNDESRCSDSSEHDEESSEGAQAELVTEDEKQEADNEEGISLSRKRKAPASEPATQAARQAAALLAHRYRKQSALVNSRGCLPKRPEGKPMFLHQMDPRFTPIDGWTPENLWEVMKIKVEARLPEIIYHGNDVEHPYDSLSFPDLVWLYTHPYAIFHTLLLATNVRLNLRYTMYNYTFPGIFGFTEILLSHRSKIERALEKSPTYKMFLQKGVMMMPLGAHIGFHSDGQTCYDLRLRAYDQQCIQYYYAIAEPQEGPSTLTVKTAKQICKCMWQRLDCFVKRKGDIDDSVIDVFSEHMKILPFIQTIDSESVEKTLPSTVLIFNFFRVALMQTGLIHLFTDTDFFRSLDHVEKLYWRIQFDTTDEQLCYSTQLLGLPLLVLPSPTQTAVFEEQSEKEGEEKKTDVSQETLIPPIPLVDDQPWTACADSSAFSPDGILPARVSSPLSESLLQVESPPLSPQRPVEAWCTDSSVMVSLLFLDGIPDRGMVVPLGVFNEEEEA